MSHAPRRRFTDRYVTFRFVITFDDLIKTFGTDQAVVLSLMVNRDWMAQGEEEDTEAQRQKRLKRYLKKQRFVTIPRCVMENRWGWNSQKQAHVIAKLV